MTNFEHHPGPGSAATWDKDLRLPPPTGSSSLVRRGGLDFVELKRLVTMRQVLFEVLGWQPTGGRGAQLRGPCPVHGSTTPGSRILSVHLEKHLFRCFKCDAGGNQLDLYAAVTRLPIYTACLELCEKLGFEPPRTPALSRAALVPTPSSPTPEAPMSTNKPAPAHEIRYGRIVGRAWRNVPSEPSQASWYSVQIQREYFAGDQVRMSDRFSRDELPVVRLVVERMYALLYDQPPDQAS